MLQTTTLMVAMLLGQVQYRQCQTVASYQQTHAQPVQTVQAYNYAQQANAYVEKVLFLPIEREDPYYAAIVHDKLRQESRVKENVQAEQDLASQVSKLSESISNLERRFGQLLDTPSPLTPQPPSPKSPDGTPTPPSPTPKPDVPPVTGPVPVPDSADVARLKADVTTIFTNNCAKCHTGDSSAKGFVMFDENDKLVEFAALDKLLIDQEIRAGKMPKNAKPLLDPDYSKVSSWVGLDHDNIVKALLNCKKKGD